MLDSKRNSYFPELVLEPGAVAAVAEAAPVADGWAEEWRRAGHWLDFLLGQRGETLGVDADGLLLRSSDGGGVRRTSWRSVRSIAARKALAPGGNRRRPRTRWYMDIALCEAEDLETLSVEVTGLSAAWPQVLHSCRSAWAAARMREPAKPLRPRKSALSWSDPRYTLRRG